MLHIVHFTNTYAPAVGGIEKAVARLFKDHTEAGHFCRVVAPQYKGAEHSKDGVLRASAITGVGPKRFSIRIPTPTQIANWMEAIEPSVLHTHHPFMLGDTAWRISRERGCPLVFTHHTLYERYAEMAFLDKEWAASIMLSLTTRYANRCDLCIAPTESIRKLMIERGIETPVEVAPTGIEIEPYQNADGKAFRDQYGLSQEDKIIGHLGRITSAKNIDYLVEAVCCMLAKDTNLKFLLVGEGEMLNPSLKKLRKKGFDDRVISTGNLSGQDVADAYAAMNVFLFASHTDTQGLVLAESMAAGTPVIALDAPGARDCLRHEVCSLLLDKETKPDAFAQATLSLLADEARLTAFSKASREHARNFERKHCSRRTLELYEELVESHKEPEMEPQSSWERFIDSIEAEMLLLEEKVAAADKAFSNEPSTSSKSAGKAL